jgi:hypothetical protein
MNNNNIIMRLETQQHDFQLSTGRPGKIINWKTGPDITSLFLLLRDRLTPWSVESVHEWGEIKKRHPLNFLNNIITVAMNFQMLLHHYSLYPPFFVREYSNWFTYVCIFTLVV